MYCSSSHFDTGGLESLHNCVTVIPTQSTKRAYQVGARVNQSPEFPRLLTSVEEGVETQLSKVVSSLGDVQHLTVLSPFFDPDGRAVLELAKNTRANQVRIALPPGGGLSCFPFPAARRWTKKVSAVGLEAEKENRRLHAKWIEWKIGQGTLSFTGSVNATHQSLCSTKNISDSTLLGRGGRHGTRLQSRHPTKLQHTAKRAWVNRVSYSRNCATVAN